MQSIGEVLTLREVPVSKIVNKRQYVLSLFLDEINSERVDTKYAPMKASQLAFKLSHLKIHDLEYMFSVARDYKKRHGSFSKFVFGSIKAR